MRPASIQDVLDLKKGHLSQGVLRHEGCGGQIIYSFVSDCFKCTHGDVSWSWAFVFERKQVEGKPGLYQWRPPIVVTEG